MGAGGEMAAEGAFLSGVDAYGKVEALVSCGPHGEGAGEQQFSAIEPDPQVGTSAQAMAETPFQAGVQAGGGTAVKEGGVGGEMATVEQEA